MAFNNIRRSRTTPIEILQSYASRLAEMPQCSPDMIVIDDQPIPVLFPKLSTIAIVVSPGDGAFRIPPGSRDRNFTEEMSVVIGIYQQNRRDRPGRAESRVLNDNGLLEWKQRVLAFLELADISQGKASRNWEPVRIAANGDLEPLCRSTPYPLRATPIRDVDGHTGWIGMQITYHVPFDWDLYGVS